MRYTDALGLLPGDVVSIVGSGGKTSLLWHLAEENRGRRVLVSTTTKMWVPPVDAFDWDISAGRDALGVLPGSRGGTLPPACSDLHCTANDMLHCRGAQCAPTDDSFCRIIGSVEGAETCGRQNAAPTGVSLFYGAVEDGKILAPDMWQITDLSAKVGLTLLECDGSGGLPLKGWASHEPVVPDFTTVTIGVLPLWAIGQRVCEAVAHRMPEFCRITGAVPGGTVTAAHLARVVGHPEGLFAKARGRRVLFLNSRRLVSKGALVNDRGLVKDRRSDAGGLTPPLRDAQAILACLDKPMAVLAGDIHRGTVEVFA